MRQSPSTTAADDPRSPIREMPGGGRRSTGRAGVLKSSSSSSAAAAASSSPPPPGQIVSPIAPSGDLGSGDEGQGSAAPTRRRRSLKAQIQSHMSHQQKVQFRAEEAVRKFERRSGSPAAVALLAKARVRAMEQRQEGARGEASPEPPSTSPPTAGTAGSGSLAAATMGSRAEHASSTGAGSGQAHRRSLPPPPAPPHSPPQPLSPLTASSRENVTADFSSPPDKAARDAIRGGKAVTRLSRHLAGKSTPSSAASVSSLGSSVSAGTSRNHAAAGSSVRSYSIPFSGEDYSPKSPEDPSDALSRSTAGSR